jgi:hypothetical protein
VVVVVGDEPEPEMLDGEFGFTLGGSLGRLEL